MSVPQSNQDMEELPSLGTPLPEPNLNFMVQIHSLLNGESPAVNTPNNNVPGAPDRILVTSSQDENNGALDITDGINAGTNDEEDEVDTTSVQGGVDPIDTTDNGGMLVANAGSMREFFNLDVEQQAETLIHYQHHLSQVVQ